MDDAEYRCLIALDVEHWSARRAVDQAAIQRGMDQVLRRALQAVRVDEETCRFQPRGDGFLVSLPGRTSKRMLTRTFVRELGDRLAEHNADVAPAVRMRWRVGLHGGDIGEHETAGWSGRPVVEVCRLLDAEVVKRVLAQATRSLLVLVLTPSWYEAVVGEGRIDDPGFRRVRAITKDGVREAWVSVPGLTVPPGLRPEDGWRAQDADRTSASEGERATADGDRRVDSHDVHVGVGVVGENHGPIIGTVHGDYVNRDKHVRIEPKGSSS